MAHGAWGMGHGAVIYKRIFRHPHGTTPYAMSKFYGSSSRDNYKRTRKDPPLARPVRDGQDDRYADEIEDEPLSLAEEIAERAEVSKSTLFRYFETKEDLVFANSRAYGDTLLAAFAERPSDESVLRSLRAALVSLVSGLQADRSRYLRGQRIVARSPSLVRRSIERQYEWEDGLATALLPRLSNHDDAETRASVLAAAGLAVVRIATRRWVTAADDSLLIDHLLPALDVLADELKDSD